MFLFVSSLTLYGMLVLSSYVWLGFCLVTLLREIKAIRGYPNIPRTYLRATVIIGGSLLLSLVLTALLWYTIHQPIVG